MMAAEKVRVDDEAEIRALVDSWLSAVKAKDVAGIVAHYAPDIVAFDAIAQLRFEGVDAYREHWAACFTMCPGAMTFELRDLTVTAADGVAFCHCLNRCGGTDDSGVEKAAWMRATIGLRRTGGRWLITHEHWSAPFDPESGKVLFDLQP